MQSQPTSIFSSSTTHFTSLWFLVKAVKKSSISTRALARPWAIARTASALESTISILALGKFSLAQSMVQARRTSTRVYFSSFSSCHLPTGFLSVVNTPMTSVWSGTVYSITLARSELRVSPPSDMSIVSATRNGTRWAVSVGTHSGFSFNSSAILVPMVMSKPSKSPEALRWLKGGELGWMPIRRTPALMMTSRLLALAEEMKKPAAISGDRAPKARRENFTLIELSPYLFIRMLDEDRRGVNGILVVYKAAA